MTVLVIGRLHADRGRFERLFVERAADMLAIAEEAKAAGALHHRFALGDGGLVVLLDEWQSVDAFRAFFDTPRLASVMKDAGVTQPPEFTIVESYESIDQF